MITQIQELRWNLQQKKEKMLLIWGLHHGLIALYDDQLIEKLRTIYYGGLPASIILLSDSLTNGHCYDSALLMSRAFLDEEGDVKLLYAAINSIKLNPKYICDDPLYSEHCIVERITSDNKHLIYDTSSGLVYDKRIYWLIENPKIRHIRDKNDIKKFTYEEEKNHPLNLDKDKYVAPLVLPILELNYGKPNEIYSLKGIELLQREIEYYKSLIDYEGIITTFKEDVKKLKL